MAKAAKVFIAPVNRETRLTRESTVNRIRIEEPGLIDEEECKGSYYVQVKRRTFKNNSNDLLKIEHAQELIINGKSCSDCHVEVQDLNQFSFEEESSSPSEKEEHNDYKETHFYYDIMIPLQEALENQSPQDNVRIHYQVQYKLFEQDKCLYMYKRLNTHHVMSLPQQVYKKALRDQKHAHDKAGTFIYLPLDLYIIACLVCFCNATPLAYYLHDLMDNLDQSNIKGPLYFHPLLVFNRLLK
jgi:hypothetical protein